MKSRNHKSYEGFPAKMISYHSKEYATAMAGAQPDAYQGAKPGEKIAVANAMAQNHGVGPNQPMTMSQRKQFMEFQKKGQEKKEGMSTLKKAAIGTAAVGAAGTAAVGYGGYKAVTGLTKRYAPNVAKGVKRTAKEIVKLPKNIDKVASKRYVIGPNKAPKGSGIIARTKGFFGRKITAEKPPKKAPGMIKKLSGKIKKVAGGKKKSFARTIARKLVTKGR